MTAADAAAVQAASDLFDHDVRPEWATRFLEEPAQRTYQASGATDREDTGMLTWRLDPGHPSFDDD